MPKSRSAEAPPTPDAEARRAIREDLDRTFLVEAAAGTGKTTSLVERMVALLREGKTTVDRLSAVTFTIKAAAQLKQRFQLALEQSVATEADPIRRERLAVALSRLDSAFLGTIHAFGARLLRERPVEAGVEPGFQEMDETEDGVARTEAWERYGERLLSEESGILPQLAQLGVPLRDLKETFDRLCENADVELVVAAVSPAPDLSPALAPAREFLARARADLAAVEIPEGADDTLDLWREALRLERVCDSSRPPDVARLLAVLDRAGRPTWIRWGSQEPVARRLWAALQELQSEALEPALRRWREFLHPILIGAIVPAVSEYAAWRRREGRLNFQDLLLLARNLLRDHPDVRAALRSRFAPVLVDEFQDTDPVQAEILLYLTSGEKSERDWRLLRPVPGSLFVVGDPKQSVYRFRRADIETYNRVREAIEAGGGAVLTLTTNFRSAGRICDWVNRTFEDVFPSERSAEQAGRAPLTSSRPPGGADCGAFRLEFSPPPRAGARAAAEADAQRVARWIEGALADRSRGLDPGDFLILLRRRRQMAVYARALESRGVPYEISGGAAFRDSRELNAFLALLESLADPDDPVALLAALRGRIFGVDDRALYRFRRAGGRFSFRYEPPPGTDSKLARALEMLRESRKDADALPPGAAISRVAGRLGIIGEASAETLGQTRAGNLLKAIAASRELSARGEDFSGVVRRLASLTREGDVEEMGTEPGRPGVARILTLHRAKGLEARYVFLVDPSSDPTHEPRGSIDRSVDPPKGYFRVVRSTGEQHGDIEIARPAGWEEMCAAEQRFEEAERDRVLYVAATRAADALVVTVPTRADGVPAPRGAWAKLAASIPDRLADPAPPPPAAPRSAPGDFGRGVETFAGDTARALEASATPTYSTARVTAIAHSPERPEWSDTGRGMAWGRILHRLLEAAMRDPKLDVPALAANLFAEEERPAGDLGEAVRLVEVVRGSELWRRALAAKRTLVEVPFALPVPSRDLGVAEGPAETLLNGAIDLVFEEEWGWALVDYKSDAVDGNRNALVAFYSKQIELYARYWRELTGRKTRAGLFFIQTGEEVWLE